jgi:hypothetical protein
MVAAASPALSVVTSEWGASPLAAPKNFPMLFTVSAWPLQAHTDVGTTQTHGPQVNGCRRGLTHSPSPSHTHYSGTHSGGERRSSSTIHAAAHTPSPTRCCPRIWADEQWSRAGQTPWLPSRWGKTAAETSKQAHTQTVTHTHSQQRQACSGNKEAERRGSCCHQCQCQCQRHCQCHCLPQA